MLTLDETTLFYFSLYSYPKSGKKGGIKNWASSVASFAPESKLKTKGSASSKSSQVPSLTKGPSNLSSSTSVLTNNVLIFSDDVHDSGAIHANDFGGLQDEDETMGPERDLAASSPVKGKTRLTSTVAFIYLLM